MVVEVQQERGHEHKLFNDDREKARGLTLQRDAWEGSAAQAEISDSEL